MNALKIAKENLILESYVGSKLYGTETPESDTDIRGVFIPTKECLFGLNNISRADNSIEDKTESGKNSKDAKDCCYESLHNFCNLAIGGSPNIIERLFVPDEKITFINEFGKILLENRNLFVAKNIIPRFLGYATSQKHKMIVRTDNFKAMNSFCEYLTKFEQRQLLIEINTDSNHLLFGSFKENMFNCGDMNFEKSRLIKDVQKILKERLDKASNRKELILKHGTDTKFSSHLIRLLLACKELLETGKLVFPYSFAQHILDIKLGKIRLNDILKEADEIKDEINQLEDTTDLREKPDFDRINSMVIDMTENHIALKDIFTNT